MGRPYGDSIDPSSGLYIALENMNFFWTMDQVKFVENMWNQGISLHEMAMKLKRDPDELALLLIDRARREKIKTREGGIFGLGFNR